MKKLIISENEKNNILKKYYTKLSLNEVDYAGDTGKGTTPTTTTVAPSQQQAPAKNYTIQELQQLLGVKADGYAGPNTLAALEKALQSKGTSAPATTANQPAAQPTAEKPKDLSATPVQTKTATGIDTKTGTVTTKDTNAQQSTGDNAQKNTATPANQPAANQSETGDDPNS